LETVAVEIKHQVVDKVEAVADDDQRQLVRQLGLLQKVLDALGVVAVGLAADALHLLNLARLARRLNVLEVNLRILAEVDDGAQEVEQALKALKESKFSFNRNIR